MSSTQPSTRPRAATEPGRSPTGRDRRVTTFRAVGVLILVAILTGPAGLTDLVGPWALLREAEAGFTPELHRWHQADVSALVSLLACGSLAVSLRRPRSHPVAIQVVLVAAGLLAAIALFPVNPEALVPSVGVVAALVAAAPDRRALARFTRPTARSPLTFVALAAAPPLLWNAVGNLQHQFGGGGEHAELRHWIGSAALAVALAVAGLLAAGGRPGARSVAGVVAVAYAYLGVAALTIPRHDGSWGRGGGLAALTAAVAFAGAAWIDRRRTR